MRERALVATETVGKVRISVKSLNEKTRDIKPLIYIDIVPNIKFQLRISLINFDSFDQFKSKEFTVK